MRIIVAAFHLILAGCGKPEVINQPESAPADSVSLIMVNASSPATGASIIAIIKTGRKNGSLILSRHLMPGTNLLYRGTS